MLKRTAKFKVLVCSALMFIQVSCDRFICWNEKSSKGNNLNPGGSEEFKNCGRKKQAEVTVFQNLGDVINQKWGRNNMQEDLTKIKLFEVFL